MKEPPPDPQGSILLGWCLILLSALPLGGFTVWHVVHKLDASTWPRAQGEVLASDLYRHSSSKSVSWCIRLQLRYQVDGKSFGSPRMSSSRIAGAACDFEKRVIEARLERMQPGDRVTIHDDPQDPATGIVYVSAVLEFIDAFLGIVAVVWSVAGIAAIREGRRMRRAQRAQRAASAKPALR